MKPQTVTPAAIEIRGLVRSFGHTEAVHGLDLTVPAGSCFGFFGRNGAGKTTTIKCLLNLLRPDAGSIRVFGFDPVRDELEVKRRIAYVPDQVAFYPWMSVREALAYAASFRPGWNHSTEAALLERFRLDPSKPVTGLSKGQRTQLALIAAIGADPELLVLDEPTSGLDPIVRREFIEAVIGAYQDADPGHRTVFVSTHLISEFEGLIDRFTIIEAGRAIVTMDADEARAKYRRLRARFSGEPPNLQTPGIISQTRNGRELELVTNGATEAVLEELRRCQPEDLRSEALSLEEIFVAANR
jgi:ABC-2 type transport system ATP-binding protein